MPRLESGAGMLDKLRKMFERKDGPSLDLRSLELENQRLRRTIRKQDEVHKELMLQNEEWRIRCRRLEYANGILQNELEWLRGKL